MGIQAAWPAQSVSSSQADVELIGMVRSRLKCTRVPRGEVMLCTTVRVPPAFPGSLRCGVVATRMVLPLKVGVRACDGEHGRQYTPGGIYFRLLPAGVGGA